MPIEIDYKSKTLPSLLSNLSLSPFVLDGMRCGSVEGLIWGLKEIHPRLQRETFEKWGAEAKVPSTLECRGKPRASEVFWQGVPMAAGSPEHHAIVRRAVMEKFRQNAPARVALISTGDELLSYGQPDSAARTSFPPELFLDFVTSSRAIILGNLTAWILGVITQFQDDNTGRFAEMYLRAHSAELGNVIALSVSQQVLDPAPVRDLATLRELKRDVLRAIQGMLALSLGPGPVCAALRTRPKDDKVTLQDRLSRDLVWTICAEIRSHSL